MLSASTSKFLITKRSSSIVKTTIQTSQTKRFINSNSTKIQTILFQCDKETASKRLTTAAASAFGGKSILLLMLSRFGKTFLGLNIQEPVTQIAIIPMLLPYFKVDLSLRGRITIGDDNDMDIAVTALDGTLPGFLMSPLHELNVNSISDTEPVKFDPQLHSNQYNQEIQIIPFSVSPLSLLTKLASYPRSPSSSNVTFNPASFKSDLFAIYPMYLPVYLAEFADNLADESRRVTCLAFANQASPGFAVFPTFLEEPRWVPNGSATVVSIAGVPVDRSNPSSNSPGALAKLKPQLDALLGEGRAIEFCQPFSSTDPMKELEDNPRVMIYSENSQTNKKFISASLAVMAAESNLKFAEAMPDEAKTVVLSKGGLKVQDVKEMKNSLRLAIEKLKKKVEKPQWLKDLEASGKKE